MPRDGLAPRGPRARLAASGHWRKAGRRGIGADDDETADTLPREQLSLPGCMSEQARAVQVRHVARGVARRHERPQKPSSGRRAQQGAVLLQPLPAGILTTRAPSPDGAAMTLRPALPIPEELVHPPLPCPPQLIDRRRRVAVGLAVVR